MSQGHHLYDKLEADWDADNHHRKLFKVADGAGCPCRLPGAVAETHRDHMIVTRRGWPFPNQIRLLEKRRMPAQRTPEKA